MPKVAGELPSADTTQSKGCLNSLADIEIKVKDGTDSNLDADAAQTAASEVRSYADTVCQQSTQTPSTDDSDTNTTDTTETTDTTTTAPSGSATDLHQYRGPLHRPEHGRFGDDHGLGTW